jgi:methionyl-tRNA formyltransferase
LGARTLMENLDALHQGRLTPVPQDASLATYAAKIDKSEAPLDWSRPAVELERQVRAFNPWPVAETTLDGEQLRIYGARPTDERALNVLRNVSKSAENGAIVAVEDGTVLVRCGRDLLALTQVQQPGRNPVSARDFSHSHQLLGRRLG